MRDSTASRDLTALSTDIDTLRLWLTRYVADGAAFEPKAIRGIVGELTRLKCLAETYEALLTDANQILVAARADALRRLLPPPELTDEHLADPDIIVFPGPAMSAGGAA